MEETNGEEQVTRGKAMENTPLSAKPHCGAILRFSLVHITVPVDMPFCLGLQRTGSTSLQQPVHLPTSRSSDHLRPVIIKCRHQPAHLSIAKHSSIPSSLPPPIPLIPHLLSLLHTRLIYPELLSFSCLFVCSIIFPTHIHNG